MNMWETRAKVIDRNILTGVEFEFKNCPLGCTLDDEIVLTGRDRLNGLPGEFTVIRCKTCGLMRTNPRPTPETIGLYYPDTYGPYQFTKVTEDRKLNKPRPVWKRLVTQIFEFNTERIPAINPGKMLEIGCASGSFMHCMAKTGWDVEGIEFSPQAAEAARSLGHPVYTGSVETAPEPKQPYDLVVGWMVLEHLHDPILSLKKLHRWTKPGGWLVVSVPDAGALEFRIFKHNWYGLHLPNHLYHYTPITLDKVLKCSRWSMQKVYHQRVLNNLVASIGCVMQDMSYDKKVSKTLINFPQWAKRRHHCLFYPLAYFMGLVRQTGRITVWAQKLCD